LAGTRPDKMAKLNVTSQFIFVTDNELMANLKCNNYSVSI